MVEMYRRLAEIAPLVGSRRDVENHLRHHTMASHFEPVRPPQPRLFSFQNTLELAYIYAFRTAGLQASAAVAYAGPFVAAATSPGRGAPEPAWLIFAAGDHSSAIQAHPPDLDSLSAGFGDVYPPVFTRVNLAEIYRRVAALFSEKGVS
jgi:hypothetical protein